MKSNNNSVVIAGTVSATPTTYKCCGELFWTFDMTVTRQSGTVDTVTVNCPKILLGKIGTGDRLCVSGQVRTYAKSDGGSSRLNVVIFVLRVNEPRDDCNEVTLEGYLCNKSEPRRTPSGREICYGMLAVNREHGKSDYIPQVFWGRSAKRVGEMPVGTRITVCGRLQSRSYVKNNTTRIAYEVSVDKLEGGHDDS